MIVSSDQWQNVINAQNIHKNRFICHKIIYPLHKSSLIYHNKDVSVHKVRRYRENFCHSDLKSFIYQHLCSESFVIFFRQHPINKTIAFIQRLVL